MPTPEENLQELLAVTRRLESGESKEGTPQYVQDIQRFNQLRDAGIGDSPSNLPPPTARITVTKGTPPPASSPPTAGNAAPPPPAHPMEDRPDPAYSGRDTTGRVVTDTAFGIPDTII